jgi:hypothetical protein
VHQGGTKKDSLPTGEVGRLKFRARGSVRLEGPAKTAGRPEAMLVNLADHANITAKSDN